MTIEPPLESRKVAASPGSKPELVPRIVSGLLLAGTACGAVLAGPIAFTVLVAGLAIVMSWEWGRVVRRQEWDAACVLHAFATVMATLLALIGHPVLGLLLLVAAMLVILPIAYGSGAAMSAAGVFYIGLPALSLVWIRTDEPHGKVAIFIILIAVWATDTGAFLFGRSIGGPRLWPSISPNKTWAGLIGGILTAALVTMLAALVVNGASVERFGVLGAGLGMAAHVGDLSESALKRHYGVKDASRLIPGHGGFMDRLDSLVGAAIVAGAIAVVLNIGAPAASLLFLG